jgi:hypothetical protein
LRFFGKITGMGAGEAIKVSFMAAIISSVSVLLPGRLCSADFSGARMMLRLRKKSGASEISIAVSVITGKDFLTFLLNNVVELETVGLRLLISIGT